VLVDFLWANKDIFAWRPSDMPRVPKEIAEHALHVHPEAKPIKERLRHFAANCKEIIREEIKKLLAAGFIKEVYHPDWSANPVLVRKSNKQWRMCVDYTDLNRACPKDPFGLPRIDQAMDSTAGCELLSFLDAYSGYHRIALKKDDCIKTSFITLFGAYCYTTMPFGLKNAGATYQRKIQRCLHNQLGRNVEAYVDDAIIKTKTQEGLIMDFEETFNSLCAFKFKLNPEKCTFSVPSGKLLSFMVSRHGIEADPGKIAEIHSMQPPASLKDLQKLTGCMASLSHFTSRLGERSMPFFMFLKKTNDFTWTNEAQTAFDDFKRYLTSPPILVAPLPEEQILLYIAATTHVVSTVLVVEREEGAA
jgi:hypothetical protein